MFLRPVLCFGVALMLVGAAAADVPHLINYQGILLDDVGNPVTSPVNVVFAIWDAATDGDSLWSEQQAVSPDGAGRFNVLLGSVSPIPDSAFAGAEVYLSIKVAADPEMLPRRRLGSVAYAFRDNDWALVDCVLFTGGQWGIARARNVLYGDWDSTHVNLGVACTTGTTVFDAMYATVGGGVENAAAGFAATVGGGCWNTASQGSGTVGGGHTNKAGGSSSTVGGGEANQATGDIATIGGGAENTASSWCATVGGGQNNTASGDYAAVSGGLYNKSRGAYSVIAGGGSDVESDSNYATGEWSVIGGGYRNSATYEAAAVLSGQANAASGENSVIAGGWGQQTSGGWSFIGGGQGNVISDKFGTIGGGNFNNASAQFATIGGGNYNNASGQYATIGGGYRNSVQGNYSCIPGGERDTVTGEHSLVFGYAVFTQYDRMAHFFDGDASGRVRINRDDNDIIGVPSSAPLRVGTDASNGNGAYLSAGGAWMPGSSRTFKENFQAVDTEELLAKLAALPVESWNYKNTDERHIGPVAEDFVAAFDVGIIREDGTRDNQYLSPGDVAGVALLAVKELDRKTHALEEKSTEINQLKAQVAELQELVHKLVANGQ